MCAHLSLFSRAYTSVLILRCRWKKGNGGPKKRMTLCLSYNNLLWKLKQVSVARTLVHELSASAWYIISFLFCIAASIHVQ